MWGAVVAPAGSMKSPAAAAVERVLNRLEDKAREEFNQKELDAKADTMIADAGRKALRAKLEKAAKSNQGVETISRDEGSGSAAQGRRGAREPPAHAPDQGDRHHRRGVDRPRRARNPPVPADHDLA